LYAGTRKDTRTEADPILRVGVPTFDLSLEIARTPQVVFAYLTDVSKLSEWQSSAVSASADGPVRLGARIRERRKFAGRDVQTDLEVIAYEPHRRFDVKSRGGPVSFEIRHTLEPTSGGTRLAVHVDVKVGAMMRIAAAGPLKIAEREFRGDFERLEEILERGS
jgi:carbon monoxide dehydrogenase subunit G